MEKPSFTDIRVMANKAAQSILEDHTVRVHATSMMQVVDGTNTLDEYELTGIIAESLMDYFGVKR
jgi:hypothetical protein